MYFDKLNIAVDMIETYNLTRCFSVADCKRYLKIFSDFLFDAMGVLHKKGERTYALAEAKLILQQVFFKILCVNKMLDGVSYDNDRVRLNNVIDYSSLHSIVREVYELLLVVELLYVKPDTEEKKLVMFDLFQIQGFKERQKYSVTTEENKERLSGEFKELELCVDEIRNTQFYKGLEKEERSKIDYYIKDGIFRVVLDDNNFRKVDFENLGEICGVQKGLFDNVYSFMSLHAHPSYISLMQLEEAYKKRETWESLSCSAVMQMISLLSIFVSDYCRIFEMMKELYNHQPDNIRFALDFYNHSFRGDDYCVNQEDMKMLFEK